MSQTASPAAPKPSTPPKRRTPRFLTVSAARHITPNMIRITLTAPELGDISAGCEGAHCKIMLPEDGQSAGAFAAQLADGPRPVTWTCTVRHVRPDALEMDIDFVAHSDEGRLAWRYTGNLEWGSVDKPERKAVA